jgi:fructose-specific phosphotransferase system IIB component
MKIVAVTSCITGIAHTYMAAEALEQAAKKAGYEITVETQGSAGSSPMKQSTIDAADVVIFATDLEVKDRRRFNGKPFLQIGVSRLLLTLRTLLLRLFLLSPPCPRMATLHPQHRKLLLQPKKHPRMTPATSLDSSHAFLVASSRFPTEFLVRRQDRSTHT